MIKSLILIIIVMTTTNWLEGQIQPALVVEQTIKIGNEKEFFYSFAEGDEIIFDLQVIKGKNVKEVEIIEYPYSSKFVDFKTKKVSEKKIKVTKTAIYKFRIKGGGLFGNKVCRVKILRIPGSEATVGFDTSVKWKIRLDSVYTTKRAKELVQVDTTVINIVDRIERVHSYLKLGSSNTSSFNINLPQNKSSDLQTSELISWAYWIGVGNEGEAAYEKEKKNFLKKNIATISTLVNPMAGLALGAYVFLYKPAKGDNVNYNIKTFKNGIPYSLGYGNSVVSSGRVTDMTQGGFTISLRNDEPVKAINVNVKVSAVVLTKMYRYRSYKELQVKKFRYPVLSTAD